MLAALGTFLATIVSPLTQMGQAIQLNTATFVALQPALASKSLSTVAFAGFAGPWIEELGDMAVGLGSFLTSLVTFLQALAGLL